MAVFRRFRDVVYAVFFLFHLATVVLVDGPILFQRSLFPPAVLDIFDQYVKDFKDPIAASAPVWVKSLLYFELVTMVPFMIVGVFGALMGARWMRIPSIMYGTAMLTACLPLVAHLLYGDFTGQKVAPKTQEERCYVAAIYGIYVVFGAIIALDNALFRKSGPAEYQGRIGDTGKQSQKKRN